jgi:uncharacterized repeat protein (TIGR03803 family)
VNKRKSILRLAIVGVGITFMLTTGAWAAAKYKVLYSFAIRSDAGQEPAAGLVLDSAGNLYGTTSYYYGAVFELTPGSGGQWTETTLYDFKGGSDAFSPYAPLIFDPAGKLYGTTIIGGGTGCYGVGCGTVFELSPASGGTWTESVLYSFTGGSDGSRPQAGLVRDSAGNLYGTSTQGGDLSCGNGSGCGVVFKLTPKSGVWTETVLYKFNGGVDGAEPYTGVLFGKSGNIYGTTALGGGTGCGGAGCGTVFELTPMPSGAWKEKILYRFKGGTDGAGPVGTGLIQDAKNNFYGTTGGGESSSDWGSVFKLAHLKSGWKETVLHHFTGSPDAGLPGGVIFGKTGNLYGAAYFGGGDTGCFGGCGAIFELSESGGVWKETILHNFRGNADGRYPAGGLTVDTKGNFYGATMWGGSGGYGTVFQITPP